MTIYRFGTFKFDASRHELRQDDEVVNLRPKTRMLLGLLIENRAQPLKHAEILERVWPTTHAGNNNLFQAISELRSAFKPLQPIRTIPNLGYEWCVPLRQERNWIPAAAAAAACLVVVIAASAALTAPAQESSASKLPPAYRAFFAGMDYLDDSKPDQAITQFELAIAENPEFSEAYLLLAQSLIETDELDKARSVLGRVLQVDHAGNDPYAEMTAMEMMGQINQLNGSSDSSLQWTKQAFDNAEQSGYICAAGELESRLIDVEKMLTGTDEPIDDPRLVAEAEPMAKLCADIPPRLKSSAIEACNGNVETIAAVNRLDLRGIKESLINAVAPQA